MSNIILDLHAHNDESTLPSASVLKPLYVWLALKHSKATSTPIPAHIDLEKIITQSENIPTTDLTNWLTLNRITETFNHIIYQAGSHKENTFEIPETWGQYPVNGKHIYTLYRTMVDEDSEYSRQVLQWMNRTVPSQRFGFVSTEDSVKAGWDLIDNQMTLLIVTIRNNHIHVFVHSTKDLTEKQITLWEMVINNAPERLPAIHEKAFQKSLTLFNKLINM